MLPDIDIPTVPPRQRGVGELRSRITAGGIRQRRSWRRRRARQKANDLADFASAQIPSLLAHDAIGEREPDALSAQLPQGFGTAARATPPS
jgi:hypothetical protein